MGRLVVVSNRVPSSSDRHHPAGGLAVALQDALRRGESLWFGWSGKQVAEEEKHSRTVSQEQVENVTYATIDLTHSEFDGFYQKYSNGILWPLCHYRAGLMDFIRRDREIYLDVNKFYARKLRDLLRPDDIIWVHDYHLFPFAQALRNLGVKNKIGFFLHIPFPPWSLMKSLPSAVSLLKNMQAYDVIGLQTEDDARNMNDGFMQCGFGPRAQAFPIGIDPDSFARQAEAGEHDAEVHRLKASLRGRPLVIGVDRLDYSKGLPERFLGYEAFLKRFPEHKGKVMYLQITPVSRGNVADYKALKRDLDETAGRINGMYGDFDWTPIRYLTQSVPRHLLAGFYRLADAALVTPLRDGMNLVAKEFVAAQKEHNPGSLILSRFAGAAAEMEDALLVNPHDPEEISDALHRALIMPKAERLARGKKLRESVWRVTASSWARDFLEELSKDRPE
ncbi:MULTISPECIES: alpha,alpha-trehalose-phosphate synthase (UDP-forming) [Acetobacter]|uniref:Trehalose-6-phosphate synthase n=1 Tax=Acetobacter thailandicus TaxID=1502842 RepID=A0ABT3QD61_9PROT|nr:MULTISPECIES: trehalose-6-phosphate synthase [Acetobacter]MBS0960307.1 trehalose-6-phosphate synthase [Acetobacter thailandicus]MBS0985522.1 trehalose-6-phosphate synthase [Acetobacter thailandicus]MBS1003245.1 trehalose-6-phosphate synthase [Acetobacter thailandicus]MCX2563243.1 trehalose-6-phosphate synthase [Acetobacter thailandicus]NHN93999.1 trehalose-6-phosphate synthase [Acetobacter thailandicus]